eukprot:SAG11_NODE_2402_length_3400_cov_4.019691_4_plen_111_part_00
MAKLRALSLGEAVAVPLLAIKSHCRLQLLVARRIRIPWWQEVAVICWAWGGLGGRHCGTQKMRQPTAVGRGHITNWMWRRRRSSPAQHGSFSQTVTRTDTQQQLQAAGTE